MSLFFFGIPEIDIKILNELSDHDLVNTCRVNKYARELCQDDYLWQERIRLYLDDKIREEKPDRLSWREWYFFWQRFSGNPILRYVEVLNLTPIQGYIFLETRIGVLPGSEAFQSINLTLPKAFSSGDQELVNYFMGQFNKITKEYFAIDLPTDPLLNYGKTVSIALRQGYLDYAKQLLGVMKRDHDKLAKEDYDMNVFNGNYFRIAEILGELKMESFFNQTFLPLTPEYLEEEDFTMKESFLEGLIMGHHNEEVKKFFPQVFEKWEEAEAYLYLYQELIEAVVKAQNLEILPFLNDFIPEGEKKQYQETYIKISGHDPRDIDPRRLPEDVFESLLKTDPNLAMDYYEVYQNQIDLRQVYIPATCSTRLLDELIKQRQLRSYYINYETCSSEIIQDIIIKIGDSNPHLIADIISGIANAGRYELMLMLNLDLLIPNAETWRKLIEKVERSSYKDIYVYLLNLFAQAEPQAAQEYFDNLSREREYIIGPIENYLFQQELSQIKVEDLASTDFYSLLILPYFDFSS